MTFPAGNAQIQPETGEAPAFRIRNVVSPWKHMRKDLQLYGKIQARRKALGLSQEELAQRMGVSRQSVTKWETGLSAPDLDRLVELADTLGVSLDYLLRDQAEMPEGPGLRKLCRKSAAKRRRPLSLQARRRVTLRSRQAC